MSRIKGSFRRKRTVDHWSEHDKQKELARLLRAAQPELSTTVRTVLQSVSSLKNVMRVRRKPPVSDDEKELALLVMRATSPEESSIAHSLLQQIAHGVVHCKTAELDAAVRALGYRICNSNSQIILNSLNVADYLLCHVTEPRSAATNLRSVVEKDLLPKVTRLAKGLPPATRGGIPPPSPAACDEALRRLQEWASTRFLSGALAVKHAAFAEAFRDASLHCILQAVRCDV